MKIITKINYDKMNVVFMKENQDKDIIESTEMIYKILKVFRFENLHVAALLTAIMYEENQAIFSVDSEKIIENERMTLCI